MLLSSKNKPSSALQIAGSGLLHLQKKPKATAFQCASVAFSYMACAVALLCFNKTALSLYDFPFANVITLSQLIVSTMLLYVFKRLNLIAFVDQQDGEETMSNNGKVPKGGLNVKTGFPTVKLFRTTLPLALAYLTYMLLSMISLRGVNLPMYTTLRRTTGAFTMATEFLAFGKAQERDVIFAVMLMVLGAIIAGMNDMEFNLYGYFMVVLNNVATSVYLIMIGRVSKKSGLNAFGLMWTNGIWCGAPLFALSLLRGEVFSTIIYINENSGFVKVLFGSCVLAFALNYSIFLNTSMNSALTQAICGNVKDLAVVWIGYIFFGGVFQWANFSGMIVGVFGSVYYAAIKLKKTRVKDPKESE